MATKAAREIKEHYVVDESGKRVSVVLDPKVYKDLLAELKSLRANVAKLRGKNGKRSTTSRTRKTAAPRVAKGELSERERVDEILRAAGLLSKPTAKEKQLVAEWNAISTEERTRLVEEFRTAKFDKPLSEIVIENRR